MISAGIVTFNPDLLRLRENVSAILPQVDEVVIFDNGSANIEEIEEQFDLECTILKCSENVGIAAALNEICRYSDNKGYEWVLTLDDDSVSPENMISEYSKYMTDHSVGMISPRIQDRNIGEIEWHSENDCDEIDASITSASLLNLAAWRAVGGFWDELFIDMVDFDICWKLKERGYKILRVNTVALLHELGHSCATDFRGNKVAVLNHSPQRYYYIFRNTIAVGRKHNRRKQCFRWNMKRLWIVIRHETKRAEKLSAISKGVVDGLLMHLGKRNIQ